MCGEHDTTCTRSPRDTGSSPHVRGAHSTRPSAHCRTGIIPACAGSTLKVSGRLRFAWDYPRMCGEHIVANRNCGSVQGSSPHVRGARAGRARPAGPSGIIPACAGSTPRRRTGTGKEWDHPRMCGEHYGDSDFVNELEGSSPHVRGARAGRARPAGPSGIIPACAGSTPRRRTGTGKEWDHPRMCGEHYGDSDFVNELEGSSPHVRGARFIKSATQDAVGIIPACAGSTVPAGRISPSCRDHPRMCGEHQTDFTCSVRRRGSSPHVRGAPRRSRPARAVVGIIPACAGSTGHSRFRVLLIRDHPRMCGEHRSLTDSLSPARGSSPHVRGALAPAWTRMTNHGIIPACAGSTS